jgi:meso-butanediol dehydrogenase/(S,S)-butanediol dehydrogenase/diacetyl reductase
MVMLVPSARGDYRDRMENSDDRLGALRGKAGMNRFEGRVALITGAARGIGRASALRLAAEGASVVIADLDEDAARSTVDELAQSGLAARCDVTDPASVDAAMAATQRRFGRLDVLVNNVGVSGAGTLDELDDAEWARQVEPTLHGAIRCIGACLPLLLTAPGGGRVVSIASVNGMAAVGEIAYSAAKAGLINASRNLAVEYGPRARGTTDADCGWVRFNVVAPGTIRTRAWTQNGPDQLAMLQKLPALYPMGRVGEPDDIAAAVAFLASDDAAWITGVTLPVDGGFLAGPYTVFDLL